MKILDCTLRDGGYYTNWDFDKAIVDAYIGGTNILPIDYLEIGYRNNPSKEYLGKYGYCPIFELEDLRKKSQKKLAVMLNEKNVTLKDLDYLLSPIDGLIDMVRLAIDPNNFDRAVKLAEIIKKRGFEVGFNTMYMSKWKEYEGFISKLKNVNGIADLFCMVDSYGGVYPDDVQEMLLIVKENVTCPVGFHGHNNLELGLINTLTAINNGVDFVDTTILGMGRGAGNLKTELLLTYMNKNSGLDVDFNVLGDIILAFSGLLKKYEWGTNLPYMLSGANSLPQKDVMDWVSNRVYSFNSIVRALDNKKEKIVDNAKFPLLSTSQYDKVIIIGGGENAVLHKEGIKEFIRKNLSVALIYATSRNAMSYFDLDCPKYYCLVGTEGKRLSKTVGEKAFNNICVLPPYPRKMGTDVPEFAVRNTFELGKIEFTTQYPDSCTAIALQIAIDLGAKETYIVGYDGYPGEILSEKEMVLTHENKILFTDYSRFVNKALVSLTPTLYKELEIKSIYQYI
ncbi:hypothetical protein AE938_13030 [Bacteroides fragilis]|uniref:aldolase catalytic domain-containing protein n=1 Tax=Bacteroides fragilis TaxID=817 RepID=UPI001CAA1B9C|nr:aldolase catalytic domain-containing protein [Bacteroides fragilis]MBY2899770.1 hypothetical protein [Bacteroides fragilis]MCM0327333.1 aldolase catalytic domain-containing protein [Bacteroides fragilis]